MYLMLFSYFDSLKHARRSFPKEEQQKRGSNPARQQKLSQIQDVRLGRNAWPRTNHRCAERQRGWQGTCHLYEQRGKYRSSINVQIFTLNSTFKGVEFNLKTRC